MRMMIKPVHNVAGLSSVQYLLRHDHLEQQLFPVHTWGQNFVATKSKARGREGYLANHRRPGRYRD